MSKRRKVICEIFVRSDSSPDKLKALAEALDRWHSASMDEDDDSGIVFNLDDSDLEDLYAGELPQPRGLQVLSVMRKAKDLLGGNFRLPTIREAIDVFGADRSILMVGKGSQHYSRENLNITLRNFVSSDLVADIQIDGCSWNDESRKW